MMADAADTADEFQQEFLKEALANRKRNNQKTATGRCLNCDYPLNNNQRYCDRECLADHDYRLKRGAQ